ncbi:MAG TPA: hypothetical protein VL651_16010 [Bacteroidia bacterium]|jgi:hypothetical protein|nr:hypothetical protein [Bacteroidia bacterium]
MKKLLTILFLIPLSGFSQDNTDATAQQAKTNELGVAFLSMNSLDIWANGKNLQASIETRFPVGLMYNHHFGKNILRFTSGYFVHVIDVNNDAGYHYYYRASGADRNLSLSLGYAREFRFRKLSIDPFADLTYRYQLAVGRESTYGDIIYEEDVYFKNETDLFGARIGVNFSYQLNPYLAVSAEFSEGMDREYYHNLLSGYDSPSHYQRVHFNPIDHIGIAFCF